MNEISEEQQRAWAIATRDGKDPVVAFADIREYRMNNKVWNTYPSVMICKVVEALVLKRLLGISGLVTKEEFK